MVTVTVPEDCGNSPRKKVLKEFNVAFAEGDVETILDWVTDDIRWIIFGKDQIEGKENFGDALRSLCQDGSDGEDDEWFIDTIITHGDTASCDGSIHFAGEGSYAFCDVYRFNGHGKDAKIQEMKSYVIELEKGEREQ